MVDLITDLQNATTGTRELDARVCAKLQSAPFPWGPEGFRVSAGEKGWLEIHADHGPSMTTAALGLTTAPEGLRILMDYVRERWPGKYSPGVRWDCEGEYWWVGIDENRRPYRCFSGDHPTDPAIALAIAILRAEEAE